MKRLCSLLLLLALMLSLAACGGDPYSDGSSQGSDSSTSDSGSITYAFVANETEAAFAIVYGEGAAEAAEWMRDRIALEGIAELPLVSKSEWESGSLSATVAGAILLDVGEGAVAFDLSAKRLTVTAPEEDLASAVNAAVAEWLKEGISADAEGVKTLLLSETVCDRMEKAMSAALATFTVMTQNIRCASDPNGNSVAERLPRFLQLMEKYSPDLLGTQETTHEWNMLLAEELGEEYGMIGLSRGGYEIGDGTGGKWDEWNTIFYKKDRFTVIDSGTFWLSETPDVPSRVETSSLNRIATWAILEDKRTGEKLMYVNTHFEHTSEEARTDEAYILQEYLAQKVEDYPVYLTGDFNTYTDSLAYIVMTDLLYDAKANAAEDGSGVDYTYHGYGKVEDYIDFIFYYDTERAPVYASILSETYDGYVSDHFGVYAVFALK